MDNYTFITGTPLAFKKSNGDITAITAITELQNYLDSEPEVEKFTVEKNDSNSNLTNHIYFIIVITLLIVVLWNVNKIKNEIKDVFVE